MCRRVLVAMILASLGSALVGCGGADVPPAEERPGLKQRQETQPKEKKQQGYMKPD
ncbi:MAG TPA: hypothetical protein VGX70_15205 [Gemmataceae bacterium]|nr:hypothetical protein [Gemmataceae bacterium]